VAVYPVGTRDTAGARALCGGEGVEAGAFSSGGEVEGEVPAEGWVFVRSRVFKMEPVRIGLMVGKKEEEVRALLADDPGVQVVETGAELVLKGDSLKVSGNGYLFALVGA